MPNLELWSPDPTKPVPPLPPDVPEFIDDANKLLTESFWVGEALGIDVEEAETTVNNALNAYYTVGAGAFSRETMPTVHALVTKIADALHEGLDDDGRKYGPIGDKLAASDRFDESGLRGSMCSSTGRTLTYIQRCLRDIQVMFEFAMKNGLWVHWT